MGKIWRLTLFLIIIIGITFNVKAGEIPDDVWFPDPNLETVIRIALDKPSGLLTEADLLSITELNARESGIGDLSGLELLKNLRSLNLRGNSITDISPLISLTELRYLNLHSNTAIQSIAPIKELTNLETLIIRNVPIKEQVDVLRNLVKLKRLNINNTGITDLTVIGELMNKGALQNDYVSRVKAVVDINNNPILVSILDEIDGYAPIREYWSYVGHRSPVVLPSYSEQKVVINEIMASNGRALTDKEGDTPDWIELYNPTNKRIQLRNFYLSDDPDDLLKWMIPPGTWIEPHGFLLIWASGKNKIIQNELHTNFKIDKSGEPIILTYSDPLTIIDYLAVSELSRDISYGRQPDGSGCCYLFDLDNTSPGRSNNSAKKYIKPDAALNPVFSHEGGFYQQPFTLELKTACGEVIYYTLDGTIPDPKNNPNSTICYDSPILIQTESVPAIGLTRTIRRGTIPKPPLTYLQSSYTKWFLPTVEQFKGTVIRARAYNEENIPSEVVTKTFFIDPQGHQRHTMPVIAITVEPLDFFDYETGIYLPGVGFHENLPWAYHHWGSGNFHGRGSQWERPIHIEFWETDGSLAFAQNAGVRIHGDASRAHAQKSLRIIAADHYDQKDSFDHEIFPGRTKPFTDEPYTQYKTLILRNGGNTWENTMFKDGMLQNLLHHTNLDVQYFRPAVVYINGEYWGIHNIRDRYDEWYIYNTYGIDPDRVEMFKDNVFLNEGSAPGDDPERENYRKILKLIDPNYAQRGYPTVNTLADPIIYEQVKQLIDMDLFLDYAAVQIYIQNFDWPGNNIRLWRLNLNENDPEAPFGYDGLWRWMIFDLDLAFSDYNMNNLANATRPAGREWHSQPWATFLLRSLFQNEEFCREFINRSADHMNSTFLPEVVTAEIDRLEVLMEPEMEEHIHRWNKPAWNLHSWKLQNNMLRIFASFRPDVNRRHIRQYFNLTGDYQITLNTDYEQGYIKINSLNITYDTPGVIDANSWSGSYFKGVPITLTAVAHPGYEFLSWIGVPEDIKFHSSITITPDAPVEITAVFKQLIDK